MKRTIAYFTLLAWILFSGSAMAEPRIANIPGASTTPDDLILILAGLGIITEPLIVSATPVYSMASATPVYTLEAA